MFIFLLSITMTNAFGMSRFSLLQKRISGTSTKAVSNHDRTETYKDRLALLNKLIEQKTKEFKREASKDSNYSGYLNILQQEIYSAKVKKNKLAWELAEWEAVNELTAATSPNGLITATVDPSPVGPAIIIESSNQELARIHSELDRIDTIQFTKNGLIVKGVKQIKDEDGKITSEFYKTLVLKLPVDIDQLPNESYKRIKEPLINMGYIGVGGLAVTAYILYLLHLT